MGVISKKLAARLQKAKKQVTGLRRLAVTEFAEIPTDLKRIRSLIHSGHDPLHAAYVAAQNYTSGFAEAVTQFRELDPYCDIAATAEDEYIPDGPPISPLTRSYFTTWAFFDLRFGSDRETLGTCLLDLADLLELHPFVVQTIRQFQNSRMGIYEHIGIKDDWCRLRELVTDEEFQCHIPSGYRGKTGELWYVRLCPPLLDPVDYHVAFTTPYLLTGFAEADWTAYLKKNLLGASNTKNALHEFLKFGKEPNAWNEFIFEAYHHHQDDAIFLAGLPDVKSSRPNAG